MLYALHVVPHAIRTLGTKGRGTNENGEDRRPSIKYKEYFSGRSRDLCNCYLARNDLELEEMARNVSLVLYGYTTHLKKRIEI